MSPPSPRQGQVSSASIDLHIFLNQLASASCRCLTLKGGFAKPTCKSQLVSHICCSSGETVRRLLIIYALHKHWHLKTRWSRQKGVSKGYQEYQFILTLPPLVLRFWKGVGVIFNRGCPKDVQCAHFCTILFSRFLGRYASTNFSHFIRKMKKLLCMFDQSSAVQTRRVASFTPAP